MTNLINLNCKNNNISILNIKKLDIISLEMDKTTKIQ